MSNISFDLNTAKVHDAWSIAFALRELISNAIDEEILSKCGIETEILFNETTGILSIRDYGRGIRLENFVQAQDATKSNKNSLTMGKFGYGLKDAIAVLYNRGHDLIFQSSYLSLRPRLINKACTKLETIHMIGTDSSPVERGTLVEITGVESRMVDEARALFVRYGGYRKIAETKYGAIYEKKARESSKIFINGQRVAVDDEFSFHYDIIPTPAMREKFNRERDNLGKSVYIERVVYIIREAKESEYIKDWLKRTILEESLQKKGEFSRKEIRTIASNLLCAQDGVVLVTQEEIGNSEKRAEITDQANILGKKIIVIDSEDKKEIIATSSGTQVPIFENVMVQNKIEYDEVPIESLTSEERVMYDTREHLFSSSEYTKHCACVIVENLREGPAKISGFSDGQKVYVSRESLKDFETFAEVYLHEMTHHETRYKDNTREFEYALGRLCARLVRKLLKPG